jgi:hypothetical protein
MPLFLSTNLMYQKSILRVRSVLPMMIAHIPLVHAARGGAGCRLCDLQRLRLAVIGEGDIYSSVGLSSAVNKFSSGRTIRQSVKTDVAPSMERGN